MQCPRTLIRPSLSRPRPSACLMPTSTPSKTAGTHYWLDLSLPPPHDGVRQTVTDVPTFPERGIHAPEICRRLTGCDAHHIEVISVKRIELPVVSNCCWHADDTPQGPARDGTRRNTTVKKTLTTACVAAASLTAAGAIGAGLTAAPTASAISAAKP
jgi:hypothetical protein